MVDQTTVHVVAIVASAIGATWAIRSKLSELETRITEVLVRLIALEKTEAKAHPAPVRKRKR